MVDRVRTVDFLPQIFQTPVNRQFLNATLDQLTQEPAFQKTEGFIGRTVGPGVNPEDRYVIEPDKVRSDYQLEPGVVSLDPTATTKITSTITYPGINDAIKAQGGFTNNADRLYVSDYYTFDPFIDFDKFVNYSEYYWVPEGPPSVTVTAVNAPLEETFTVVRDPVNHAYRFKGSQSNISGNNPRITLVRNGSYTFNIAQGVTETITLACGIIENSGYVIDYPTNTEPVREFNLVRGNTYIFNFTFTGNVNTFYIRTQLSAGTTNLYSNGVTGNGGLNASSQIIFTVPPDAPDTLYYSDLKNASNFQGQFNISNPPVVTGPKFWIQETPGVTGKLPYYPNISSRIPAPSYVEPDTPGVINNGIDFGVLEYDVPRSDAQTFYYELTQISNVDLICSLPFATLNNLPVAEFLDVYGSIDGISNLNGRTLVFPNDTDSAVASSVYIANYTIVNNKLSIILTLQFAVNNLEKFTIQFGTQYSNTSWYKSEFGQLYQIPLLFCIDDILYYQDDQDPLMFGEIQIVDEAQEATLNVAEILGREQYTSPNGVVFTNGLVVEFQGPTFPTEYQNNTYYVEGVGTGIRLINTTYFVTPEPYTISATIPYDSTLYDQTPYGASLNAPLQPDYVTINRASQDLNGWTRSNRWFHIDTINAAAAYNNTPVILDNSQRGRRPIIEFRAGTRLFNFGSDGQKFVNSIDFNAVNALEQVAGQTSYTVDGYAFVNGSRVIFATDVDPNVRNKIYQVDFIDPTIYKSTKVGQIKVGYRYEITDVDTSNPSAPNPTNFMLLGAANNNVGTTFVATNSGLFSAPDIVATVDTPYSYTIVSVGTTDFTTIGAPNNTPGTIFQATGPAVGTGTVLQGTGTADFVEPIIKLTQVGEMLADQTVVVANGITLQGTSWTYDGVIYTKAQEKTKLNQAPLFDVYDAQGISFGNRAKYPSSTFVGSKLFSYAIGNGASDVILKFPLKYFSLFNLADIVFDNNLYTDTFNYVQDNVGQTEEVKNGFVREYSDRLTYKREIGWQRAVTKSIVRQQFKFIYDATPLQLDVAVVPNNDVPAIQLYINAKFQDPSKYTYEVVGNETLVTITTTDVVIGDVIELQVISDQVSQAGFYTVPINLENNALNMNSSTFTSGTIRRHYQSICENLLTLQGPIDGANNTRDLGNLIPYGTQILQQSAPLTLAGYFMRNAEYDIFGAIEYNSREYIKFKTKLLENSITNDYNGLTIPQTLDAAILDITSGKTDTSPFYWSDMMPSGNVYQQTKVVVNPLTTNTFNTRQVYNYTSANYLGMNVYLNNVLLVRDLDYVVSTEGPAFTILLTLAVGDVVVYDEYSNTAGSFIPNTPSKMGLYPKFEPKLYLDTTYIQPTLVILGHDGSKTIAFDDYRTDILLEFEKRIYNNIKLDGNPVPLTTDEIVPGFFTPRTLNVLPGYFRGTDYSNDETNAILNQSFLSWVGWNKLDYRSQNFLSSNAFTWNYSQSGNKLNEEPLLGAWRGIYRYFYDTETPNTTPWEMLGFSVEPTWWQDRYGAAPYTSGNGVLWDDLELGYVADPIAPYIVPEYARPGLSKVIPVGPQGELLPPQQSVVGAYDPGSYKRSWALNDGGPVEYSWWTSSSYPFAAMRLLALTRPALFFSLFADRDLYKFDADMGQYLYNGRFRLDANGVVVYGDGISKASYINWIVDYNKQLGIDSTATLQANLQNLDVRLCYRMASFSDKQYIKIYCERSSPNSQNTNLLIPPQSYQLLLYKNVPFDYINYSSIIVEITSDGYQVYGYSNIQSYFNVQVSSPVGLQKTFAVAGKSVKVPDQYTKDVAQVPYGTTFINDAAVVDFILSYGQYLTNQGLLYEDRENGYTLNWEQMANEFLYFAQQGWAPGTIINLNPSSTTLRAVRPGAVVDSILSLSPENMLLNQNKGVIPTRDLIIERYGNDFSITSAPDNTISFLQLKFTSYEHIIVLDNATVFADLIYDPITAARQSRLKLVAATSTDWNGTLDAQGFILNDNNVKQWESNKKYAKGEIVLYKNIYYSAQTIVQPKVEFDYNDWVKSEYSLVQQGLLPNIANKADQLANTYNTQVANLDADNDLFAYGLIGYRPREYMAQLNLDDVTQVQLYQQFLGTKGTIRAAEIFTRAQFGTQSGAYNIYENWATLIATYGAQANRSFIELRLNEALLPSNPSTVQVTLPGQTSEANQKILLSDVWRESYKLTDTNILPTTYATDPNTALPSAGYVNFKDADINVFSLDDPSAIAANLDTVGVGTVIWVAKINSYDWGIYRCESVPGYVTQISDNLNATSVVSFSKVHGLSVGDTIIIRFFNEAVDGVYRVISIPSIQTIVVAYDFNNSNQTTIYGNGVAFYLQTMRVYQASDIYTLPYTNKLTSGAKVWVDNDGTGKWEVLEKQEPFAFSYSFSGETSPSHFGASVAQSKNVLYLFVGAPGETTDVGAVYGYLRDDNEVLNPNGKFTLNTPGVSGFGNSMNFGNLSWCIVGADRSLNDLGYVALLHQSQDAPNFAVAQLLLPQDDLTTPNKFGTSVVMNTDETWAYVTAPLGNKVYAFAITNEQYQFVTYDGDGVTTVFNWDNSLVINKGYPDQIFVIVNKQILTYGLGPLGWLFDNDGNIVVGTAPALDVPISFARRQSVQLDTFTYANVPAVGYFGDNRGAEFTVQVVRGQYSVTLTNGGEGYAVNDQIVIFGTQIGGASPADDITITILDVASTDEVTDYITNYRYQGSGNDTTTTFDLVEYLYTAKTEESFTVIVNGVVQRLNIDYTFSPNGGNNTLTFLTVPGLGARITVNASNYWSQRAIIDTTYLPETLPANALFGASIDTSKDGRSIIIGAPYADGTDAGTGAAYVFDRSAVEYVVKPDSSGQIPYVFAMPVPVTSPVAVKHNGVYLLTNSIEASGIINNTNIGAQAIINYQTNLVTISTSIVLVEGDIIQIETNDFIFVEKLISSNSLEPSQYGLSVAMNSDNSGVYVGQPNDDTVLVEAGSVDRLVNVPQVYGIIESPISNPTLTTGDTIRINDVQVTVAGTSIADFVTLVNNSNIPNVSATTVPDLIFEGDGYTQQYYIGDLYSSAQTYNTVVYVNNVLQPAEPNPDYTYTYDNATQTISFVVAPNPRAVIRIVSGRLILNTINPLAAEPGNLMSILPGTINISATGLFNQLAFTVYQWTQNIVSPYPVTYGHFGAAMVASPEGTTLVVGAPNGTTYEPMTFDAGLTVFDERSTTFYTPIPNSGVVYTFDYLPSASDSPTDTGKFIFGEQVYTNAVQTGDEFGASLEYIYGELVVGAPKQNASNIGYVSIYGNPGDNPAWTLLYNQLPAVDIALMNDVYLYNRLLSSTQTYLDFFNPLQGKILAAARRNIDFIGAVDPANYNTGPIHNVGDSWAEDHVGEIWWDTDTVRFVDPNQDDIVYASRRWGQIFPGSRVDIYQWVSSSVPPVEYIGPGTALTTLSYTVKTYLNAQGVFVTEYFFWVRNIDSIATTAGKTLSTTGIASYITSPRTSGIPYIAPLTANAVALYNCYDYLSAFDAILHIDYDRELNDDNIHTEYKLIADGKENAFLNDALYRKMIDSFCGADTAGNNVPDASLSPPERYGVQFRPRQSMFMNRYVALQNYLVHANNVLIQYPITEIRSFALLNTADPIPNSKSGAWDKEVANLTELYYQNIYASDIPVGYKYLVLVDDSANGLWTIYEVVGRIFYEREQTSTTGSGTGAQFTVEPLVGSYNITMTNAGTGYVVGNVLNFSGDQFGGVTPVNNLEVVVTSVDDNGAILTFTYGGLGVGGRYLQLAVVQNFDTKQYWQYVDWYQVGYNSTIQPIAEVTIYSQLDQVTLKQAPIGSSVRVTTNSQGKWEIYLRTAINGWERVGLQLGTIQFLSDLWNYQTGRFGFDAEVFDAQYYDQEPTIETRQIIRAINEELFIDELLIERNKALMTVFEYVYSEFEAPNWLFKTSLIDVSHEVAALEPTQIYQQDNQNFIIDYINEVKPYHVQIREFSLAYAGNDEWPGSATDFDVPAFYDTSLVAPQYVSPILLPYTHATTPISSTASDKAADAQVWQLQPWSDWFANYSLSIDNFYIVSSGSGYTSVPTVVVEPPSLPGGTQAVVTISGLTFSSVTIEYPGSGYFVGDTLTIQGGIYNGSPMILSVVAVDNSGAVLAVELLSGTSYVSLPSNPVKTISGQGLGCTVNLDWGVASFGAQVVDVGSGYVTNPAVVFVGGGQLDPALQAKGYINLATGVVRSIKTVIKYDRTQYRSDIIPWEANVAYVVGELVRYNNQVFEVIQNNQEETFIYTYFQLIPPQDLSGVNRTMGYYVPGVNMPGLSLPLLIDGVEYPGVQVFGPDYNAETNNVLQFRPETLDAIIESDYTDTLLGTRPTDVITDGGNYLSYYASYAPEELVPGEEFDTMDFKVFSRPGGAKDGQPYGFAEKTLAASITNIATTTITYAGLIPDIFEVNVNNTITGVNLLEGVDYQNDWINGIISFVGSPTVNNGDIVEVTVYGIGGGSQLFVNTYNGGDVYATGNFVVIPVDTRSGFNELQDLGVFVDGIPTQNYTSEPAPLPYAPNTTLVSFNNDWTGSEISLVAIGPTYTSTFPGPSVDYDWSTYLKQVATPTGNPAVFNLNPGYSLEYTNPVNAIVMVDGLRVKTPACVEYIGDGTTTQYASAVRIGVTYASEIADSDLIVYLNNVQQTLNVNYTVLAPLFGAASKTIQFTTAPAKGSSVIIACATYCNAIINPSSNTLVFNPPSGTSPSRPITAPPLAALPTVGSTVTVITWNDTRQQNMLTEVFVGPGKLSRLVAEGFGSTDYDTDFIGGGNPNDPAGGGGRDPSTNDFNDTPGSFDYSAIEDYVDNNLAIARPQTDPSRMWVTFYNGDTVSNPTQVGRILAYGADYTIQNGLIIINPALLPSDGIMLPASILMVEYFTDIVVGQGAAFRIFQDMRGLQLAYHITEATTTTLAQALSVPGDPNYDDTIYVNNIDALAVPRLDINLWGAIIIEGERIMYRYRDENAGTVSGLLRGTAGTGTTSHPIDSTVTSVSVGNLFPAKDQNHYVVNTTLADGAQTVFVAPNINNES